MAPFSPHKDIAMTAIYQPERGPYQENLQTHRAWALELWEINIIILSFIICGNLLQQPELKKTDYPSVHTWTLLF